MTPGNSPRWIALVVVVAALGGVWLSGRFGNKDAATLGPRSPAGTDARDPSGVQQALVAGLHLERLHDTPEPRALARPERDLFRFQPKAPPPRPAAPAPSVVAAPPVPAGPPPPPPIQLKFIGLVDAPTQSGRVAVLSDARGNVFYGKEGDIIDGRYRVLKIGVESAELAYVDGRGRQVLRLSGQ